MLKWTSSRSTDHWKAPVAISARIVSMPRSIAARSSALSTPTACSIRAWASEPAISHSARRQSNPTEAVKRLTSSDTGSLKRPDQPPVGGAEDSGMGTCGTTEKVQQFDCRNVSDDYKAKPPPPPAAEGRSTGSCQP